MYQKFSSPKLRKLEQLTFFQHLLHVFYVFLYVLLMLFSTDFPVYCVWAWIPITIILIMSVLTAKG